jgi:hypothetical protein
LQKSATQWREQTVNSLANTINPSGHIEGLSLRRAALIAGLGYLLMPVGWAEFHIYPKLVIPGSIEQTVQNVAVHPRLFALAILCYLGSSLFDIVIAWALYVLLAPVNKSLSLLTAWFRLAYAAVFFLPVFDLITVFRLINTPDYLTLFGTGPLHAQVKLSLASFRYDWSISLIIFAVHLVLLGCLIYRSGYIPNFIGILLVINGFGWIISGLQPYFFPNAHLRFIFITYFGELVLMLWLLIWGWRIPEPARQVS